MSLADLSVLVHDGTVDTVVVAMTDLQGRLQGKRCGAGHFLDQVATHGAEACDYLLGVDVEMATVEGYELTSWERGYGDFRLCPDLDTLRLVPWHDATALVLCDVLGHDGTPVAPSPRQVLRRQIAGLAERGFAADVGTELEFVVYRETYEEAWTRGYRDLTPANLYNVDYSMLGTSRVEPLLRRIRNSMTGADMHVENSKGECNFGQHEINFHYADALRAADDHVVYKTGIKEIAFQRGCSVTFMAKPHHDWVGSSCHIHSSLWRDGENAFAGETELFRHYLAGQIACLGDLAIFVAPVVNSYKRFAAGSWAPTTLAWGYDNRTCGFRVVGHGSSVRPETRIPGADANPYLAFAALLAAGLYGIEEKLELKPAFEGNAYESDVERFPSALREAIARLESSGVARRLLGDDVIDHYLNYARTEQERFDRTVTGYERERMFERG